MDRARAVVMAEAEMVIEKAAEMAVASVVNAETAKIRARAAAAVKVLKVAGLSAEIVTIDLNFPEVKKAKALRVANSFGTNK
jgi:hypothetical protein